MGARRDTVRKAKRSSSPNLDQARRELLALPARFLTQLPVETRLFVQASGTKTEFILTTALDAPPQGRIEERRGPCWLSAPEVDALILGVEAERVFASDLTAIALRKLHDKGFRVTEEHALAGAQQPEDRRSMALGDVLRTLDLEITGIELGPLAPCVDGAVGEPVPARAA